MPIIQNPTIGRKLQRSLRLTALPDAILAPEIVGVIVVEDESAPLSDEERGCMGSGTRAAAAGENSLITLVRVGDPATYDLVVTECHFSCLATMVIELVVPTIDVGNLVDIDTSFDDLELPGRPTSQLAVSSEAALGAARSLKTYRVLPSTVYRVPLGIRMGTIGQGSDLTALQIRSLTANVTLSGGFNWTESAPQG